MPNKNYLRGRRFEYERAKKLREFGHDVMRTAGSHGKFDLIAINPQNGDISLIQLKVTESSSNADRMVKKFRENPPYQPYVMPKGVHQILEVKVVGSNDVRSVAV